MAESSESPVSEGGAKALLHRMSELALQIAPINDPSMQRVALVYTDLADRNISVDEDGTLLGIHGDQVRSPPDAHSFFHLTICYFPTLF